MKKLCDNAYNRAKHLITAQRDKLEIIAKALLEFETLDGEQVKDIQRTGQMRNPPAAPTGGTGSKTSTATPAKDAATDDQPSLDFPGGLSGAPA